MTEIDPQSYIAVMTKGHAWDVAVLETVYQKIPTPRYLGCIGSDVKTIKIRSELKEKGISVETIAQLHCPIGLELGSNDPHEIAISVAAQMIQERDRSTQDPR